jgi:hypothetical protein
MRRRKRISKAGVIGLVLVVAVAAMIGSLLIPDYGDNRADAGGIPPQALNRIAQRNDNAAMNAAAAMRARAARDARIADHVQDQLDRENQAQPAR